MTESLTRNEQYGYAKVIAEEGVYQLRRSEYEACTTALREHRKGQRDDPLFEGEDNYGVTITIELARVESVLDFPAEAVRASLEDERMVKLRDGE